MPCVANTELPGVSASPSGPPSSSWIAPICIEFRSPFRIIPGASAFAVVEMLQLLPWLAALAAHPNVNPKL